MKELTIYCIPARDNTPARVRVSYRAEERAQAQERETEFRFAISDEQRRLIQWYLEEYLIYPWGEFRNRAQQVEEMMARLGAELFDAVFGNRETAALYAHVADDLPNTRIVIHASDPEGIAPPWELLRDPTRGEYGDLARLAYTFVRSQPDLIFEPSPAPTGKTFNILMVICRPGGPEGDVPFQSVARPLLELFRPHRDRIYLDVLRPPTFEQLSRVLAGKPNFYHVLHFDGHGTFPQGGRRFYEITGAQGQLSFEDGDVTSEELGGLLAGKGVPIVLLNACQSGMTRPESLYPSVGNQLLRAGARGVVAMAYSVYVQTAVRFMARLYEGLMNGEELARAAALAREELRAHPQRISPIGEMELRDWVVPVVFEAAPVRVMERRAPVRLDLSVLQDQQAKVGAEIDCPEPPVFGFVGRDDVTLELERAFQNETIVLLDGMAGIGKTEMAMGFTRWRAETGALDGPIFFFRFEHYLPLARVCDSVGQVFNAVVRQRVGKDWHLCDVEKRRQTALDILKDVPCLMIWDNFEPVAGFPSGTESAWKPDEQKELRDFLRDLRGGQTKVLLTSRRDEGWLGNTYHRVELGGLKWVEAQELAVNVLRRAGLSTEQLKALPDYTKLLEYLHGNPLAIQVILPELKRTTPDALLRALQAGEATLSEDDPTQGRERSLTASLTYRLDALDPTLRKRLGILALFQGVVSASILAGICSEEDVPELIRGLSRDIWIQMLDSADEVGLLQRIGRGYYTIHPALPLIFQDIMHEAFPNQIEWLESAFASVYGAAGYKLFRMFQSETQRSMRLLTAEEQNLKHALRLARRYQLLNDVTLILEGMNILLTTQGRWMEWERLVKDIEGEVTDADGEPLPGQEGLWLALSAHGAEIAHFRHDFDAEEAILLRQKNHYERVGNEYAQAVTMQNLGVLADERWHLAEAEQWFQQALQVFEHIGHELGQAQTLHHLGIIADKRQQLDEAEHWYRQSLTIQERIGYEQGQAITLRQLGSVVQKQGRLAEAEESYRQALTMHEGIGDKQGQAKSLRALGSIAWKRGEFEEAERWYRQSLATAIDIRDEQGQARILDSLGAIAEALGQFAEAKRWYRQSLTMWECIGDEHGQAVVLNNLGTLAEAQDNITEAVQFYKQSEALFARLNDPHNLGIVCEALGRVRGRGEGGN